MASAFVVGDKFRNKVTHLLGKSESALPRALGEELEEVLEKPEPTILPFSTARKIKKYLQDNGEKRKKKILNYVCVCVCVYNFITFFTVAAFIQGIHSTCMSCWRIARFTCLKS